MPPRGPGLARRPTFLVPIRTAGAGQSKETAIHLQHASLPNFLGPTEWNRSQQEQQPPPPYGHAGLLEPPAPIKNALMATTDSPSYVRPDQPPAPMSASEVIAYVKQELEADEARQAQISTTELPRESQTGYTVDLSFKGISTLPVEVVLLIKEKVERLALSHNPSCLLPREIVQCDRLRYLNLRWNKLELFPAVVLGLPKLEILDISKNDISSIPEDISKMTSLKFLAVTKNHIRRLPLSLGEMTNLSKLKFDDNPIEFPPAESLQLPTDHKATTESEKEKELCIQVKKYLRSAAIREKMKVVSEDDMSSQSETNVETPRPSKRGPNGGRFPVRPSMSGIDFSSEGPGGLTDSPPTIDGPPPIPLRSHARGLSSTGPPAQRPVTTASRLENAEVARNRSDTVSSESMRTRRRGYVPHKNAQLGSVEEMSMRDPLRLGQKAIPGPAHSRGPSNVSLTNSLLSVGGDNSSGNASPSTRSVSHANRTRSTTNASQPRSTAQSAEIKALKRVLCMLNYLHQPIADTAQQLRRHTPKRSPLQRSLFSANALVDELGQLMKTASKTPDGNAEIHDSLRLSLFQTSMMSLKLYASVAKELKRSRRSVVQTVDAFHVRSMINSAHTTSVEILNLCHALGYGSPSMQFKQDATPRVSQVWTQRTVSPTPQRSGSGRKANGATTLVRKGQGNTRDGPQTMASPSNGMITHPALFNPRFEEPYGPMIPNGTIHSRPKPLRSMTTESDIDEPIDKAYPMLRNCCDLAQRTLSGVRVELLGRKAVADSNNLHKHSELYEVAISKCNAAITMSEKLLLKLRQVQSYGDSTLVQRELWMMSEAFTKEWAEFAEQVMKLSAARIDITNLKYSLKPVQRAVKEANNAVHSSAIFTKSTKYPALPQGPQPQGLHGFPYSINPSAPPSVPATPLAAALGQAVQTIMPNPSASMFLPSDQSSHGGPTRGRLQSLHDRNDTVMQPPPSSYLRR